ncbi:MAG: hypothetical protein WCG01_03940, partial [bacterium]
ASKTRQEETVTAGERFELMSFKSKKTGKVVVASKQEIAPTEEKYKVEFRGTFLHEGKEWVVGRINKCRNIFAQQIVVVPVPSPIESAPPQIKEEKKVEAAPVPVVAPKPVAKIVEPPPVPVEKPVAKIIAPTPEEPLKKAETGKLSGEIVGWGGYFDSLGEKKTDTGYYGVSAIVRKEVGRIGDYTNKLGIMATYQGATGTDQKFPWNTDAVLVGPTMKLESDRSSITANLQVGKQIMGGSNGIYTFKQEDLILKPEILYENADRRTDGNIWFPKYEASAMAIVGLNNLSGSADFKGAPANYKKSNPSMIDLESKLGITDIKLTDNLFLTPYVGVNGYRDFGQNQFGAQANTGIWFNWHDKQVGGVQTGFDHRFGGGNSWQVIGGYIHLTDLYKAITTTKEKK